MGIVLKFTKMKLLLPVIILLLPTTVLYAQDTSRISGDIYFKPFVGWKKNEVRLTRKEFKQEIYRVPAAIPYYGKGNTNLILTYSMLTGGLILAFISSQDHSDSNGLILAGLGLVSAGLFTAIRSHHHFRTAAKVYNRQILY